ncbi:MAG: hypothetical protein N2689_18610, partial [Verrucomicrobiae bacterium]|nr:hypothetical protein [Verrucomicrobiae bacterium]
MKRSAYAISAVAAMIAARAIDLVVTYYFCPDLSREANPLVARHGHGWATLFVMSTILVSTVAACTFYYWLGAPARLPLPPQVRSVWDFASFCYFKALHPRWRFVLYMLTRPPKDWRHFLRMIGFALPPAVVFVSLFWAPLRPLRRFALILIVVFIASEGFTYLSQTPLW